MFGIKFQKTPPSYFVMLLKGEKVLTSGVGLSFLYYAPDKSIVQVPISSRDVPFVFREFSHDHQRLQTQGQLTYRISDPAQASQMLDYSLNAKGHYASDDPQTLDERLIKSVQKIARAFIKAKTMREALHLTDETSGYVLDALQDSPILKSLGVSVIELAIESILAEPDIQQALEAETRELIQKEADQAIYARRSASVEEERKIKEAELETERLVEERKKRIGETKMSARIAVEEKRKALVELQAANDKKAADVKAYEIERIVTPLAAVDWRTLIAMNQTGGDPAQMIAMAFHGLAENAGKIGELNISPELLSQLTRKRG